MVKRDWVFEQYVRDLYTTKMEREYYLESGSFVFTEHYLKKRSDCCGNGCRHCPFVPRHIKGNTELQDIYRKV